MAEAAPFVSVIVPTWHDWGALAQCLDCLAAQTLPAEGFEILIANNNPEEALPPGYALPANARAIWQPKPGSYAARNAALGAARGAVLAFTDSDCRPEPEWLEAALAFFDRNPGIDRIGGAVVVTPKGADWTLPELYDRIFGLRQERYVPRGYAATANLIVRREVFARVGGFDEDLYSSGDKEWNLRAQGSGSRIALGEDVRVRHAARSSFEALKKKRLRVAGGRFRMKRKHERRIWLPSPKYFFPALSALKRIRREPGLTRGQVLRLWALDYELRRAELRELISIRKSRGATRRE